MILETTLSLANLLATVPGGQVDASVEVHSIWDFILKGGWMMVPIGLCSLIGLAVVAERALSLRRKRIIPPSFLSGLKKGMRDHPGDIDKALRYCQKNRSPVSNVFAAGIKRLGAPTEVVKSHIEEAGQREVLRMRKNLRVLAVIAATTPLMGLLGTIFGMINAFQTIALSGEALGKAELLAEGIYEAMITTAAGLIVAIPVLMAYHWISAKIDRLVMDIDLMTVDFIEDYAEGKMSWTEASETAPTQAGKGDAVQSPSDVQVAPT